MFTNTTKSFRALIASEIRALNDDNSYIRAEVIMRQAQFDPYFKAYPHLFLNIPIREIAKRTIAVAALAPSSDEDDFLDGKKRYNIYAGKEG